MAKQELSWEDCCKSHLKIILLGGRNSGKSVVGNLLLGKEEFVARERTTCSKRQGVMAGRWISVVDTPGWWCDLGTRDTAELVKREIASSALLCFPGPHVFLIVVKACSVFSEQRRRALEQHVALLGEAVWGHCIVLLTCVDRGEHGADEKTDNSGLQWLVEKCGQRRHRLTLPCDTVGGQVTQLCVKILKLATENADRPFEIEPSCSRRIHQSIKMVEERALQRFLRTKEQRAQMQGGVRPLSDLRLVVLGATGSGKTSAVHALLGLSDAQREGAGRTARCRAHRGARVLDRDMTVVDTPGWWRNYYAAETSAFDRRELSRGVRLCPPGPHALLLVVRVDRAFTETHRRAAQEHVELLLGPAAWGHALLVFSFGDWLGDTSVERFVESEGEPLRWLVDRCGDRYHVMNNKRTGDAGFQVAELVGKVEVMVAANQGCGYLQAGGGGTGEPLLLEEEEEERRRAEQEAAGKRLLLKNEQMQALRSELEKLPPTTDLRLVLLGGRSTGRTSCGDTILGQGAFHADDPAAAGAERHARVRGVAVTVVEPPPPPPSSRDREREVPRGLSALLLVVNASSSFTSSLLEALEEQVVGGAEQKQEEEEEAEEEEEKEKKKEEEEQVLGGAEEKNKEEEEVEEKMLGGAEKKEGEEEKQQEEEEKQVFGGVEEKQEKKEEEEEEEEKQMLGGAKEKEEEKKKEEKEDEEENEEEKEDKEMRWSRAMVLFSHGDWLGDTSIEERIESEGEALRGLVERCGNRYHVLDNRHRGDGAQVHRLLEQVEEMLLGARRALVQREGDSIRNTVTPAVRHRKQGLAVGQRHRKIRDVGLPCTNNSSPLDYPAETSMSCRVVTRPEQTRLALSIYIDMNNLASRTGWPDLRGDKVLRWTLRDILAAMGILPNWSRTSSPHDRVEILNEGHVCVFPLRRRESEPSSPSHHQRALKTAAATEVYPVASRPPWQPRDDALRKLFASGDLQALIDQWGSSSLEELEAFVDAHFEMVWERAMSSAAEDDDVTERDGATGEEGAEQNEAGSSLAEGLSKLHLLEEIQRDVTEMKQSLDKCCKVMLELLEAHRGGLRPAEENSQRATHD